MTRRIPVFVYADDPISQAGVAAQLRGRPETHVVENDAIDDADVAVVVTNSIDEDSLRVVRGIQRGGCPKVVLVASQLDDSALMLAVEANVTGILRRQEATPELLAHAVVAAERGNGTLAPDLVGRLLDQVSRLQRNVLLPRGIGGDGLNDRERSVLRLLAEGLPTSEISRRLAYSERTIKNIIHEVTTRLNLRNRSHAVAYAIKAGIV
jgi:DNA-binding NarL/FixJ family response regulator